MFVREDLKDGDLVVYRDDRVRMYRHKGFYNENNCCCNVIANYYKNLTCDSDDYPLDIVLVYRGEKAKSFVCDPSELIFDRNSYDASQIDVFGMLSDAGFEGCVNVH